jgi:hypothetical protein
MIDYASDPYHLATTHLPKTTMLFQVSKLYQVKCPIYTNVTNIDRTSSLHV